MKKRNKFVTFSLWKIAASDGIIDVNKSEGAEKIMKHKSKSVFVLSCVLFIIAAFPSFAGSWAEENGKLRYYNDEGTVVSGWVEEGDNRYYTDSNGYMKTGWIKDNRFWYYLNEDGTLATDTWIDNYYVSTDGRWTKTR